MTESEVRALHLHTLDSLLADLVSGRSVSSANGNAFALSDDRARSALDWYRKKGLAAWPGSVSVSQAEDLVNAVGLKPPVLPSQSVRLPGASDRRLKLKKLEAHRFAGLHKFGTPGTAPSSYVHEFVAPITLMEGRNGSGKTSLLNAIIWALTGEMLRPQREPESPEDFDCLVAADSEGADDTVHKLSPLTPMPDVRSYRPEQPWVPADTWVQLTFIGEDGVEIPIRRSISRTPAGKSKVAEPDLAVLRVDPIAVRLGTIMPGLLPLIKVGSESELGLAVSQLTGFSALLDLTDHVRRAKAKIEKEFTKAKQEELERVDEAYQVASGDLTKLLDANPSLKPSISIPPPSANPNIETELGALARHFESLKSTAFESARSILGEQFDPANLKLLADLEKNASRALERATQPQSLTSATRLSLLKQVPADDLQAASRKITQILAEGDTLSKLAKDKSKASRLQLYARVALWIEEHRDDSRDDDICVVCGGRLDEAIDSITGEKVAAHLHHAASDASLLSHSLATWAKSAEGSLLLSLPEALRAESSRELPSHPCDLLRLALIDELFGFEPFLGVLAGLKIQTSALFDDVVKTRTDLDAPVKITLPKGCDALVATLNRLDCAIRFARWRQANDALARDILEQVLGRQRKEDEKSEHTTIIGKLLALEAIVKSSQPITDAYAYCGRLIAQIRLRRAGEKKLSEYKIAVGALNELAALGTLADEQVNQLRNILRSDAAKWRSRIYLGAFPDTAHELVDAQMGRKGELDLVVRAGGVSAPAQHVTNASALRASLVAFYLAFWEHVLKTRGGIVTLLLDDPQELLDDENRERLAAALSPLADIGAQLIVTSYDNRFSGRVARLSVVGGVEHLEVHPATGQQPTVRTTLSRPAIEQKRENFSADRNSANKAREFANESRIFAEAKLGDVFDEPSQTTWSIENPNPTLATFVQRLRVLVRSGSVGMFSAQVFRRFVDHPALVDKSSLLQLMNKAHHGRSEEIRAADVAVCEEHLSEVLELVEQMHEECYRWRRRDAPPPVRATMPPPIASIAFPQLRVFVCPDLAAFTQHAALAETQEEASLLDVNALQGKSIYYLRRPNFGFAAPTGSLAIVETNPSPAADRRLVVARHERAVYARRFLRPTKPDLVGLTAEVPDPRTKNPRTVFFRSQSCPFTKLLGSYLSTELQDRWVKMRRF